MEIGVSDGSDSDQTERLTGSVALVLPSGAACLCAPDVRGEERLPNLVTLREVADDDLPILFEHQRDPAANHMAAFTSKDPSNRDAFNAHWTRIRADHTVIMKTVLLDGRVVGVVGSYEESGRREVTFWIGRDHWGRGIVTIALSAFLQLEKARPLYARAARDNVASIRVLEKCGFTIAGQARGYANARGQETEEVILTLRAGPNEGADPVEPTRSRGSVILIRPATRDDIAALVRVSDSSIREGDDVGFGTPRSERTFADVARLAAVWQNPNLVQGEEVIVAALGERVVGYVTLEDRGEDLELINIDVDRDHQGRGIGTQLVRFVEGRARHEGKRAVTLGTSRNAAGIPWKSLGWWQALGYQVTHEEENAWTRSIGLGVREIRMRKESA
jgi:RimJ/RimL family protein N-acetyltransferase